MHIVLKVLLFVLILKVLLICFEKFEDIEYIITSDTAVYYINLDDAVERRNNVSNLCNNLNFKNVRRIPAFNTKNIENINKDIVSKEAYNHLLDCNKTGTRLHHYDLTNGSVGCFMSHLEACKEIIKNNVPFALVLEDDVKIKLGKEAFWKSIERFKIPRDTDLFLLHAYIHDKNKGTDKVKCFNCTTCYLITNKGARKVLDSTKYIERQIDWQLSKLASGGKLNIYTDRNNMIDLDMFTMGSDIQSLNCENCDLSRDINETLKS